MYSEKRMNPAAALDKKYVWHPFTQMADWLADEPLVIDSARGIYLIGADGKRYIDGVSSLWVNVHGHRRREIDSAIKNQLNRVAHSTYLGLAHAPGSRLAERLVRIAPRGLSKVFYSDSGSTAVEVALKMAFQYHRQKKKPDPRRSKFLALANAYHGDTIGSVSVGGMGLFHEKFRPLLFKASFAPSPYCYRCPRLKNKRATTLERFLSLGRNSDFGDYCRLSGCRGECLSAAAAMLKRRGGEFAAAVIEPLIQGAAGMLAFPPGYTKAFAGLCRRAGVPLIADEVATGFGRTGEMFACGKENVRPDFMALAKGITGGYLPLAATMVSEKIYGAFLGSYQSFRTFFHGHTYTANPLACAAASANLEIFRKDRTLRRLAPKIKALSSALLEASDASDFIGDVRQVGLMAGIEIVKDKKTGGMFDVREKTAIKICRRVRDYGVILRPLGNVIVIMPPLVSSTDDIKKIVSAARESIKDVLG